MNQQYVKDYVRDLQEADTVQEMLDIFLRRANSIIHDNIMKDLEGR